METEEIYLLIITIIVAVIGLLFTILQFNLAKKKRKDDLFNLRYEFYNNVSKIWIATSNQSNPPLNNTDLISITQKAHFLFGEDIAKHLLSLENKRATHDLFPDDDFNAPFSKYLTLK